MTKKKKRKSKKNKKSKKTELNYKREKKAKKPFIENSIINLFSNESFVLKPMHRKAVSTGIYLKMPKNCIGLIKGTKKLSLKQGLTILAGTLNNKKQEEVEVVLVNLGSEKVSIEKGMKIASLLIQEVEEVGLKETGQVSKKEMKEADLKDIKKEILE